MAKERIYPFAVASVRSMENKLLTKQKLLQMAEAKDAEEALRFLQDSDYGKTQIGDVHEFETMIQANLEEAYQAMGKLIPNEVFMDIFRFKNDYHNVKVLIKEEISKVNGRKFLIQGGSIPVEDLRKFFRERNYMEMPCIDEKAVEEAIELYAKTKNGRYIDTTLDRACFRVMSDAAEKLGIPYVATYVRKLADITNLKTLYRIYTLKETGYGRLCDSMELGFTAFEKACDDYLTEYVKEAKYKTLTPEPVAAYILAKETEAKCVRIIMTCKLHNIDAETIKERVREAYV